MGKIYGTYLIVIGVALLTWSLFTKGLQPSYIYFFLGAGAASLVIKGLEELRGEKNVFRTNRK